MISKDELKEIADDLKNSNDKEMQKIMMKK